MGNEIAKDLRAVCMMSGVIIWIEAERAAKLEQVLRAANAPRFVEFEGQLINVSSIEGVYTAAAMEDLQRRKNGQWQCKYSQRWHGKGDRCDCREEQAREARYRRGAKAISDAML